MYFKDISIVNFKNYTEESFGVHPDFNILTGLNGMGKTNVLEAIHYICMGKGYFSGQDKYALQHDKDFFRLEAAVQLNDGEFLDIVVKYKDGSRKEIELNGIALEKLSDHVGSIPCVIFAPEDVKELLETSEARRSFLNNTLVQYDREYLHAIILYNKLLKARNAYLKQMVSLKSFNDLYLESLAEQMSDPAALIYQRRKELTEQLNGIFSEMYARISGESETCFITYQSQLENAGLQALLANSLSTDKVLARTSCGIHKDDILFWMEGKQIKNFGSQGQLKSFILALKLAQYKIMEKIRKVRPVIMLDDIFDKLDARRVHHLLGILSGGEFGQVFITDTSEDKVPEILQNLATGGKQIVIHQGKKIKETDYEPA